MFEHSGNGIGSMLWCVVSESALDQFSSNSKKIMGSYSFLLEHKRQTYLALKKKNLMQIKSRTKTS